MLRRMSAVQPASIDDLSAALGERSYLADRGLATVLHVALKLPRTASGKLLRRAL